MRRSVFKLENEICFGLFNCFCFHETRETEMDVYLPRFKGTYTFWDRYLLYRTMGPNSHCLVLVVERDDPGIEVSKIN